MRIISNNGHSPIVTSWSEWLLKLLLPNTPTGTGGTWRDTDLESAREAEKISARVAEKAWGHWHKFQGCLSLNVKLHELVSSHSYWTPWIILNPVAVLSCYLFVTFDPVLDIANNTSEALGLVKSQANWFLFYYSCSTRSTLLGSHSREIS